MPASGAARPRSAARSRSTRSGSPTARRPSDDPALVAELTARGVCLDLCPTSNVQAGHRAVARRARASARLHRAGAPVTLSTDDTTVSDVTLTEEYARAVARDRADAAGAVGDRPLRPRRRLRRRGDARAAAARSSTRGPRRSPSSLRCPRDSDRYEPLPRDELSDLRHAQRARPQVLRRVRHEARRRLRQLRHGERARDAVLRRVRHAARGGRAAAGAGRPGDRGASTPGSRRGAGAPARGTGRRGPGRRAAARHRPVRRPRRLHDALRGPRPGGGPRAPEPVLRRGARADRALRRHGREVHRRRGDGRLGRPDGARGRRRARRSRGARGRRRRQGARARASRPARAC